jgi:hypothetical protein
MHMFLKQNYNVGRGPVNQTWGVTKIVKQLVKRVTR